MPNAYGYARHPSLPRFLSVETQKASIETYVSSRLPGFAYRGTHVEDGDGAHVHRFLERPVGYELHLTLAPGDAIVFASLDRGFRKLADYQHCGALWTERGIIARVVSGFSLAALVEWEECVRAEVNRGFLTQNHKPVNGVAGYGWKWVGPKGKRKRVPDERELNQIALIMQLHEQKYSWVEIERYLKERQITRRGHRRWTYHMVRNVVEWERNRRGEPT